MWERRIPVRIIRKKQERRGNCLTICFITWNFRYSFLRWLNKWYRNVRSTIRCSHRANMKHKKISWRWNNPEHSNHAWLQFLYRSCYRFCAQLRLKNVTFREPCRVIYSYNKANKMHYFSTLFCLRTLHVSGRFTVLILYSQQWYLSY